MRILHVTKRYWPFQGGVERYVEEPLRHKDKPHADTTQLY